MVVIKVWARKGAGNVPDVDLQEAATFISPLQRCLEDIDERFGEQAAKASEHMLLQVRSDRLQAQAEADLVFVAATTIQNVYVLWNRTAPAIKLDTPQVY